MKKRIVIIFCMVTAIVSTPELLLAGHTFFYPRSQSVDAARELVGWQKFINIPAFDSCCYSTVTATPCYTQSWNTTQLADYFFGCPTLVFSGSLSGSRGKHDILADYFGLPTDFKSSVTFKPKIRNVLIDVDWYQSLDNLCQGMYLRAHAPLVYAWWHMDVCESIEQEGINAFPAGYMASGTINRSFLAKSVQQAFCRRESIGDIQPLTAGRICCGARTKTTIAEVQVALGYNPLVTDTAHFGWNIRTSIPTGERSRGDFLFEPIVGNGGHWEFGFGLTGHTELWCNATTDHTISFYSDLNITHLFACRQRRSFDFLHHGCLSRYMLIEQMSLPLVQGLGINTGTPPVEVPAQQQYNGVLMPAINQTTLYASTSVDVQADFVLKLSYQYKQLDIDFGYNLWARSREKIRCRQQFPHNMFALKGDAQLYGFEIIDPSLFVALNATEQGATIHAGQGQGNSNFANDNVDHAGSALFRSIALTTGDFTTAVNGSAPAILLKDCDIDEASGLAPKAVSHTFFVHASYTWLTCKHITSFLGCGASAQVSSAQNTAVSQWALWLKAGIHR